MEALSYLDKILVQKMTLVYFFTTVNQRGIEEYFYIAIKGDKYDEFKKALASDNAALSALGQVLATGIGQPTDEVKERMKREYGCPYPDGGQ